jgi:hypothetical protein
MDETELEDLGIDQAKVAEQVEDFIKNREGYFEEDRTSFRRSKNLQAGQGWFERLGRAWGEARSSLTINPLKKIVDSTCNNLLRNPFRFEGLGDDINKNINKSLHSCLRDACNDGIGYFYVFHDDGGNLKFKCLSNTAVMFSEDESEYLVIDKRKEDKSKTKIKSSLWNNKDVLALSTNEIPVLTYFRLEDEAVKIYQFKGDIIEAYTELLLPRIPIVQVRGKTIKIKERDHYRGLYWEFQDVVAAMNAYMSKAAEIAIAKTPVLMPEESFPLNAQQQEAWQSNEPRNLYLYRSLLQVEGIAPIMLNKPDFSPYNQDLETLNNQITMLSSVIDGLTGMNLASENLPNETAMSVLDRRESKQDAQSELLAYLNDSAHEIAGLLFDYMNLIQPGNKLIEPIKVLNQIDKNFQSRNALDLFLTLNQAQVNPNTALEWLKLFNCPEEVIKTIEANQQGQDPQAELLIQENEELKAALQAERNKNELIVMQSQNQLQIETAKIKVELEKIDLERIKLGLKQAETSAQIALEAENNAIKQEQEQQKIDLKAVETITGG